MPHPLDAHTSRMLPAMKGTQANSAKEIQMIFSNFAFSIAFAGFINAKALAGGWSFMMSSATKI